MNICYYICVCNFDRVYLEERGGGSLIFLQVCLERFAAVSASCNSYSDLRRNQKGVAECYTRIS